MLPLKIYDTFLDTNVKEVSQLQDYVAERLNKDRDDWLYEVMVLWQLITTDRIPVILKPKKWRRTVMQYMDDMQAIIPDLVPTQEDTMYTLMLTGILKSWGITKRIYKVEPELFKTLSRMKTPSIIYTKFLSRVPYKSFYVDCPGNEFGEGLSGFFVTFARRGNVVLLDIATFAAIDRKNDYPYAPIHIDLCSEVDDADDKHSISTDSFIYFDEVVGIRVDSRHIIQIQERRIAKFIINLLLYMGSANRDIEYVETEPKARKSRLSSPVRTVKLGYRRTRPIDISQKRKVYKVTGVSDETTKSNVKRRYSGGYRAAHWHHYWVKTDSGKKELQLRWVEGTFVKGNYKDDRPVVQVIR